MQVIQIKDVCKAFDQRQVLNNISLSVEEGEIFWLAWTFGSWKDNFNKNAYWSTFGNIRKYCYIGERIR